MGGFGINVSSKGVDVTGARGEDLLLSTEYPFHKLDTLKPISFQNINITFAHEPPYPPNPGNPLGGPTLAYKITNITSFAHGYSYIPAIWCMGLLNWEAPDQTKWPSYQNGNYIELGFVGGSNGGHTYAYLWIHADKRKIYIDCVKSVVSDNNGNFPSPIVNVIGFTAKLRLYVFAEDIGID